MNAGCWVASLMHVEHHLVLFKKIVVELFGDFYLFYFYVIRCKIEE